MHFIFNALLGTFTRESKFYLVIKRRVRNTHVVCAENDVKRNKIKRKITVLRRKFLNNHQASTVVEWKLASDVMKDINFVNKQLFGPIRTPKTSASNIVKMVESEQVIQHTTRIPIIEPSDDQAHVKQNEENNKDKKNDLTSILAFPLINKSIHSTSKINEANYLRKQLQFLCGNSSIPSVSLIIQKTMSKERIEVLEAWKQSMISQLGQEGFEKYQAEMFANGNSLHHSISTFLSSAPETELHIKEENTGHWKSLQHILPNVKNVKLLEESVTHPFLYYKGVLDCFAKYKDHLVVIDWKTSKKSKAQLKNAYDVPLQIAAYVGALNFDPKFQYLASKGLIVFAYENGMPATAHFLNESMVRHYWNEWLKRVKQFWEIKKSEVDFT